MAEILDNRDFNRFLLAGISSSGICEGCPMQGRTMVGMDSSSGKAEQCDILFMGLNPGATEARLGLPFVGKAGQFLRSCLERVGICEMASWAFVNCMLCSTGNESEIPDIDACRAKCRPAVAQFVKVIKPKVIVPCGNGANGLFGMPRGITANAKQRFVSKGPSGKAVPTVVLPLAHPSSIIRNGGEHGNAYEPYLDRLKEILDVTLCFNPEVEGYNIGKFRMLF